MLDPVSMSVGLSHPLLDAVETLPCVHLSFSDLYDILSIQVLEILSLSASDIVLMSALFQHC